MISPFPETRRIAGELSLLTWQAFVALVRPPYEVRAWIYQMELIGVRSLGVAGHHDHLYRHGAGAPDRVQSAIARRQVLLGTVVSKSLTRELGPVLIALIVGGCIGTGMTAELGTMKVTEQIDALRAMAADPELNLSAGLYGNDVLSALTISDVLSGVGKSFFFAYFIAIIGCYNGLHARGGADGVGRATTNTVVLAAIMVLVADFFLTKLFYVIG